MDMKVIYEQKAPEKSNVKGRTFWFVIIALAIIALLVVVNFLPYSGILTLFVFALGAYLIYRLLNNTVFDITYTLYDDRLVFVRKYGTLSWENEVFPFEEAQFSENKIIHRGNTYPFYPDDKLKELIFNKNS